MVPDDAFGALVTRVRAGEEEAATELIRLYEPEVRREVRLRLWDPRLRRVLDSIDICQSVLANFFVRAAGGQFDLDRPEDLIRLLVTMARHRISNYAAHHQSQRRDLRRTDHGDAAAIEAVADPAPSPSVILANRELLDALRNRLSPELRELAEQRSAGRPWAEIAHERGASPEALRKKLARAVDEVARRLGLDEVGHD